MPQIHYSNIGNLAPAHPTYGGLQLADIQTPTKAIAWLCAAFGSLASNHINDALFTLTILVVVGTTLSVMTTLYTIKIMPPGTGGISSFWTVITAIILFAAGITLCYFCRKDWL